MEIRGHRYSYAIPDRYIKGSLDMPWLRGLQGDEKAVVSLIMPLADVGLESTDTEELRVLLFFDKDYSNVKQEFGLLLEGAVLKPGFSSEYIVFYKRYSNNDSERYLFFTYDPSNETPNKKDYDVTMAISKPITIGRFQSKPRPACNMRMVRDGIALQVSFLGSLCSEKHFGEVAAAVERVMARWRIDKAA